MTIIIHIRYLGLVISTSEVEIKTDPNATPVIFVDLKLPPTPPPPETKP